MGALVLAALGPRLSGVTGLRHAHLRAVGLGAGGAVGPRPRGASERDGRAHAPGRVVSGVKRFLILGDVGSPRSPPWIEQHAGRLGLAPTSTRLWNGLIEVMVAGPPDLLDALEVGCRLGPIEVIVESIEREPLGQAA